MPQVCFTLDSNLFDKVGKQAKEKKFSRSKYLNHLIELGLLTEEYQEKNKASDSPQFDIEMAFKRLERIAEKQMSVTIETGMYGQELLVESGGKEKLGQVLSSVRLYSKQRAKDFIEEI